MRILGILAGVFCLALLSACGGGSGTTTSTITLVGSSCSPTSITSQQTTQCTATVSGTGNFSSTVFWTANTGGTINATTGLFTASTVPFSTQVTITATSTQDSTKTGTTTITVAAAGSVTSVTATCSPASVQTGQLSTCSATVNGTGAFSPNVTWSASGGTISPIIGLFSAGSAGTYTITATSQQDSTKTGTATVTVTPGINNVLPMVVDGGPAAYQALGKLYVNGSFVTVTVVRLAHRLARPSIMSWSTPDLLDYVFWPTERQVENLTRRHFRCSRQMVVWLPTVTFSWTDTPGGRCLWRLYKCRGRPHPPFRMQPSPDYRFRSSVTRAKPFPPPHPRVAHPRPRVAMRAISVGWVPMEFLG